MSASNVRPAGAGRLAFVVEDDARVSSLVVTVLEEAGISTAAFAAATDVQSALLHRHPQLVVLDLSLRGSDAVEVLRTLSVQRFAGQVLLVTGHDARTLEQVRMIGVRRGLDMLAPLRKPLRVAELRARLGLEAGTGARPEEGQLEQGLQNGWLEVHYQPKIDLRSMSVHGAEALVRLRHPDSGLLPPARFLPPPADPLYESLTRFVVRRAMADWETFADHQRPGPLAVNVPASILQKPDFVSQLRRWLPGDARFPGLIVEITEDEAIADPELASEVAVQLKLYGVHMSIDDFGSGHSTFARLNELPFAEIKLDRSYVTGAGTDPAKRLMCADVVRLAHHFGVVAVAEGIESAEDLAIVTEAGFDLGQGYLFSRPLTGPDYVAFQLEP